ncbi:MAG: efflux transporter outer membrane subunit, partial [Woeseiaceae bacterium]
MNLNKLTTKFGAAGAGLMLSLAGCAAAGPDYQRPEFAVPEVWKEAQPVGIDTRPTALARWWTEFDDPLLDTLVERAVRSNLDLRLAEARIRESRALRAVTAADAWPRLD